MKRNFKKYFTLEMKKDFADIKSHGEYIWNFGKLKGKSAYKTGYMNSNYIIWCYENIPDFDIPPNCKLDFMESLENSIIYYYNDNENEKYLKYLNALIKYCKEYLYTITDYPSNDEKSSILIKLINNNDR